MNHRHRDQKGKRSGCNSNGRSYETAGLCAIATNTTNATNATTAINTQAVTHVTLDARTQAAMVEAINDCAMFRKITI